MRWLSALTTIVCLTGSVLNVKKSNLCFIFWEIGNAVWLVIDIINRNYSRALLDIVQGVITFWGIIEWRKKEDGEL